MVDGTSRRDALIAGLGILSTGCLRFSEDETTTTATSEKTEKVKEVTPSLQIDSPEEIFDVAWNQDTSQGTISINNDIIYGCIRDINAWDIDDGSSLWTVTHPDGNFRYFEQTLPAGDYLYGFIGGNPINNTIPELYVFDRNSGDLYWKYMGENEYHPIQDPIAGNSEYIAYCHEAESGSANLRVFRSEGGEMVLNQVTEDVVSINVIDSEIVLLGNKIQIYDLENATLQRTTDIATRDMRLVGNDLYYTTRNYENRDELRYADYPDFAPQWRYSVSPGTTIRTKPSVATTQSGDLVLIGSDYGIHAVEGENGEERWSVQTNTEVREIWGGIEVVNSLAFAFDSTGKLYIINTNNGSVLFDKAIKERPKVTSSFASQDGYLYTRLLATSDSIIPSGISALEITDALV